MQEISPGLRAVIRDRIRLYLKERPTRSITEEAEEIILIALHAITRDPSPRWRSADTADEQRRLVADLPNILDQLFTAAGAPRLDTFNLLHGISEVLDKLCPFEKPR